MLPSAEHCQRQRAAAMPTEPERAVTETPVHRIPRLVHLAQPIAVPIALNIVDERADLSVATCGDKSLVLRLCQREEHTTACHRPIIKPPTIAPVAPDECEVERHRCTVDHIRGLLNELENA